MTAIATSPTEVSVSWVELSDICQNGIVTAYEVQYEPLLTFGVLMTDTAIVTAPATTTNLTGLQEYVEYSISVRAYTSVGPGPYSDGVVERTEEDCNSINLAPSVYSPYIYLSLQCLMLLHRM